MQKSIKIEKIQRKEVFTSEEINKTVSVDTQSTDCVIGCKNGDCCLEEQIEEL